MIVQAETVDDVVAAVNFARKKGMKVTTRGGGHSMAACFLRDGGMLIDASRLDGIVVRKSSRQAAIGPGVISSGLNERLQQDGLAFPTAHCGTVPLGGFLLGGGVGMNTRAWSQGMSVFALEGVDIVTADGKLRRANAKENSDLFWAVRGGGPGLFGVVTRLYLKCYEAPGVIYGFTHTFAYKDFLDVVKAVDEVAPTLDKDIETLLFVAKGPSDERAVYLDVNAFATSSDEGKRKLERIARHTVNSRTIARDEDRKGSFDSYFVANEAAFPQTRWMGDNIWTDHPLDAVAIFERHTPDCPAPKNTQLMLYRGDESMPDAACSTRGRYYAAHYLEWSDAGDEASIRAYSTKVFGDLKRISNGSYINEMDQEGRSGDISTCYSPAAWSKLTALRAKWDPTGVFHRFYGEV
ncbi:FAD-binding oxidoreductase [Bradyrhizobium liaoningense]|uniref:FAD-binding oxidoreductase n=1 Tax=Bradyrhizobium liaoningense TaxID=43992 RepID=UPI001BA8461E|nr:FAD-binding oxidoreductase [Bradyrhizobium liaoningense]MBR0988034.1 FAD-binding oxidoreductase [Bradyrhizobium liaoningense]